MLFVRQGIYCLAMIFAVSLMVSAAALALNVGKTDGIELYAVAGFMIIAALTVWVFGRAVYRLSR